jgi:hypothetical protein
MNAEGRAEGARELILAVFRLAVADYRGISYDYDGPVRRRRVSAAYRADAAIFLRGGWATYLADLIGLSSPAIWLAARRQLELDAGRWPPTAAA